MTRTKRIMAEAAAATRTFLRRRTAVVFTFVFPLLLVIIFGTLISTDPGGGGLFAEEPAYYLPGYIAVVVLFTPMSRLAAEVMRQREHNRFEKLATTPLSRGEWLLAHTAVTFFVVALATILIVILLNLIAGTPVPTSPVILVFLFLGVVLFSGIGACLGRLATTQDGAIAASNTIALPMLFLAETFVPPELLPPWFRPAVWLMPLTPFTRGIRALIAGEGSWVPELILLGGLAIGFFLLGMWLLPQTE